MSFPNYYPGDNEPDPCDTCESTGRVVDTSSEAVTYIVLDEKKHQVYIDGDDCGDTIEGCGACPKCKSVTDWKPEFRGYCGEDKFACCQACGFETPVLFAIIDMMDCPDCNDSGNDPDRDEAYERAADRARSNDFEETGGKDWT